MEGVAHEDREVSKSAPSHDSISTLYSGSDPRYAGVEFDDAALVLSAVIQAGDYAASSISNQPVKASRNLSRRSTIFASRMTGLE